jgi:catalase
MRLFADTGTPNGVRHMNGWSGHTYKFVTKDGSFNYVKITISTDQGIQNLTNGQAVALAGTNPDYATQDLFDSIANGSYPVSCWSS